MNKKKSKLLYSIFLISLILIGALVAYAYFGKVENAIILGSNLISNSGFETAKSGDSSTPSFWNKNGNDNSHLLTWDTSGRSGRSIKMEVTNSDKAWFNWRSNDFATESGSYYKVEFWYKTENIPVKTGAEIGPEFLANGYESRMTMEWNSGSQYEGTSLPWKVGNTGWTKHTVYLLASSSSTSVSFYFYTTSGKLWIDDITIQKATDDGNLNLVTPSWNGIKGVCIHEHHYTDVAGMKELGVKMVRDDLDWGNLERSKGNYDFTNFDNRMAKLDAQGLEMLWILDYSNTLYNGGRGDLYVPTDDASFQTYKKAYGNYVYESVKHYKGRVKYFEIWNEPYGFWEPKDNIGLASKQYIELLKEGYKRAKEANPNAIIVSAGIQSWDYLLDLYVTQLYEMDAKNSFDILALHPYCWYGSTLPTNEQGLDCDSIQGIRNAKAIMDKYGDSNKKIWITEFGYPTAGDIPGLSEQNQVIRLNNLFTTLSKEMPYVTAVFWYDYMNDCGDEPTIDEECRFGLVKQDKTRKPAYYTYQSIKSSSIIPDDDDIDDIIDDIIPIEDRNLQYIVIGGVIVGAIGLALYIPKKKHKRRR